MAGASAPRPRQRPDHALASLRRRAIRNIPAAPIPSRDRLAGSGTAVRVIVRFEVRATTCPPNSTSNESVPVEPAAVTELVEMLDLSRTVERFAEASPESFEVEPAVTQVAVTPDFHKARGILTDLVAGDKLDVCLAKLPRKYRKDKSYKTAKVSEGACRTRAHA